MNNFNKSKLTEFSVLNPNKTGLEREATKLPSYIRAKNGPNGKTLYVLQGIEYVTTNGRLRRCDIEVLSNGTYQEAAKAAIAAINEARTYSIRETDSFTVRFGVNGGAEIKRNGPNPSANQGEYKEAILSDQDKRDINNTYLDNRNDTQGQRVVRLCDNLVQRHRETLDRLQNAPDQDNGVWSKLTRIYNRMQTKQDLELSLQDKILELEHISNEVRIGRYREVELDRLEEQIEDHYNSWHKNKVNAEYLSSSQTT